jgi:hypothetical protein
MLVVDIEDRPSLEDVPVGVDDLTQTGYMYQKPPSYHE